MHNVINNNNRNNDMNNILTNNVINNNNHNNDMNNRQLVLSVPKRLCYMRFVSLDRSAKRYAHLSIVNYDWSARLFVWMIVLFSFEQLVECDCIRLNVIECD